MRKQIGLAPQNSLILVMDQSVGEIPESMNESLVAATSSCIVVGTLSEYDGETLISLSDEASSSKANLFLAFDGVLETPTKKLSLCSAVGETLMALDVAAETTRVQVWVNDDREPNKIDVIATTQ